MSVICFQSQKDPLLVEKIMNDLDTNKDNEVDFNEFVVLVAALTVACNDFFQEQQKKSKWLVYIHSPPCSDGKKKCLWYF